MKNKLEPRFKRTTPKVERRDEAVLAGAPTTQEFIRFMLANGFKAVETQGKFATYSNGVITFYKDYSKDGFFMITGPGAHKQISYRELLKQAGLDE